MARSLPHLLHLLVVWAMLLAGCTSPVAVDVAPGTAAEMQTRLEQAGIAVESNVSASGTATLRVPTQDAERALSALASRPSSAAHPAGAEPLVPSRAQAEFALDQRRAHQLEGVLQALPGVAHAEVLLEPEPKRTLLAPTEPRMRAASVVVRRTRDSRIDQSAIRTLVANSFGGVHAERVQLIEVEDEPPRPTPPLVAFGPVSVPANASAPLRAALAALAALNLLTLSVLLYFWRRSLAVGSSRR